MHQEGERYEHVSDIRAQLKFFEQLDQIEKQRKEEQEREILLKAAKVTYNKGITDRKKTTLKHSDLGSVSLVYIPSASFHARIDLRRECRNE